MYVGSDRVRADVLQERIRQKMESAPRSRSICAATARVSLQEFMSIIDRLKDAGVENIGIVTKAPGDI